MFDLPFFTGFSTVISTIALVCAWRAARIRTRVSLRRFEQHELDLADLGERHGALVRQFKRLNSRLAMREARAERHNQPPQSQAAALTQQPDETPDEWKRRMRMRLATGTLGPNAQSARSNGSE